MDYLGGFVFGNNDGLLTNGVSLAEYSPAGRGGFLDIHASTGFTLLGSSNQASSGTLLGVGQQKTRRHGSVFTVVGYGLGLGNQIGPYGRLGIGVEASSIRLSVQLFGVATGHSSGGLVFGLGTHF